jgi:hypothetical protein
MQIEQEVVRVTTTGSAGSATGTASSGAINGFLLDVYLDFHASAPATTDTTIAFDEPDLGNILVVTNSATDALYAPRKQASDSTGAAISGSYDLYPVNGNISVSVGGSDALANAVVVRLRYLRL